MRFMRASGSVLRVCYPTSCRKLSLTTRPVHNFPRKTIYPQLGQHSSPGVWSSVACGHLLPRLVGYFCLILHPAYEEADC